MEKWKFGLNLTFGNRKRIPNGSESDKWNESIYTTCLMVTWFWKGKKLNGEMKWILGLILTLEGSNSLLLTDRDLSTQSNLGNEVDKS